MVHNNLYGIFSNEEKFPSVSFCFISNPFDFFALLSLFLSAGLFLFSTVIHHYLFRRELLMEAEENKTCPCSDSTMTDSLSWCHRTKPARLEHEKREQFRGNEAQTCCYCGTSVQECSPQPVVALELDLWSTVVTLAGHLGEKSVCVTGRRSTRRSREIIICFLHFFFNG